MLSDGVVIYCCGYVRLQRPRRTGWRVCMGDFLKFWFFVDVACDWFWLERAVGTVCRRESARIDGA